MARGDSRNNRGRRGRYQSQGNDQNGRNQNQNQRNQNKRHGKFQNNFVENEKVVIKYKVNSFSKEQVKTKFLVYGEDKETTYTHQSYKGKNDEELLQATIKLWEMIDEYKMQELTPERTRATDAAIICNVLPALPNTNRARQIGIKKENCTS